MLGRALGFRHWRLGGLAAGREFCAQRRDRLGLRVERFHDQLRVGLGGRRGLLGLPGRLDHGLRGLRVLRRDLERDRGGGLSLVRVFLGEVFAHRGAALGDRGGVRRVGCYLRTGGNIIIGDHDGIGHTRSMH